MMPYDSGELEVILRTHGINMANANRCRERHAALVDALEKLRESAQNGD